MPRAAPSQPPHPRADGPKPLRVPVPRPHPHNRPPAKAPSGLTLVYLWYLATLYHVGTVPQFLRVEVCPAGGFPGGGVAKGRRAGWPGALHAVHSAGKRPAGTWKASGGAYPGPLPVHQAKKSGSISLARICSNDWRWRVRCKVPSVAKRTSGASGNEL